jgi:hypothetical protein
LAGKVPLHAVPRLLPIFDSCFAVNPPRPVPDWTTSRLWLMRLGLFQLCQPLRQADDWVWLVDHSVQIGQQRCLAVLGGRLSELPCGPLQRADLQLLHLKVMHAPNMHSNYQELRQVLARTGPPRAILSDHGADLRGALRLLRQDLGPARVLDVYDIKHRAALALKERLEEQPRWAEFLSAVGRARNAAKQTEWAFLLPPVLRTKSRYLNLGELVRWSERTCWLLEHQPAALWEHGTVERLQEKLGWLLGFRRDLECWRGWYQVAARAEQAVRNRGLYRDADQDVRVRLEPVVRDAGGKQLASELVAFVGEQCQGVRSGECVPGSTEVLESCFGTLKTLEKDQSRSGFTGLVLGLGALLGQVTKEVVHRALNSTPIKAVRRWYQENIGESLQSKRGKLYRLANVTDLG